MDAITIGLTKQYYHDPRPYMVAPWIKTAHCSKEFGNPSGHCSAGFLVIAHFLDIFHGTEFKYTGKRIQSSLGYYVGLVLIIVWLIVIPYQRLLDGVHSIDQVILGSIIGTWEALVMHFLVRDNLYYLLLNLSDGPKTVKENVYK